MKIKLMIILVSFSFFLHAEEFMNFSQFQHHIRLESQRVMNKNLHNKIITQKDLRDYSVGDSNTFWRYDLSIMPPGWEQATATCRAVGEHCYIFVSDEEWNVNMDQEDVDMVFNYLENTTMNEDDFGAIEMDIDLFGPIPNELDNDEKIIVYYSALGSFNGITFDGYFSSYNQVTESEAANMNPPGHSNETEMIYMTCSPLDPSDPTRISVLSHELQHMIHWGGDINESTWVDEGMAELAMVHFGMPDPITSFNSNANYSLNMWDQQWKDYVKVLLFFTYLDEQIESEGFIADLVAEPLNGIEGIRNQLIEHGYQAPFETFFTNWTIANYLDEDNIYNGIYNYSELELPTFSYNSYINSFPSSEEQSVQPWATRYIKIFHTNPISVNIEVDHQMQLSLLTTGTNVESLVELSTIVENDIIDIPQLISPYNMHVLVLSNANDEVLNYSFDIYDELGADGEISDLNDLLNLTTYPNPFSLLENSRSNAIKISFSLNNSDTKDVELSIYNIKGQKIKSFDNQELTNSNSIVWNGRNDSSKIVSAGIYFCKLEVGNKIEITKMVLIK